MLRYFSSIGQSRASLVAQMVKNLPAMQETWVRSLDQEDPLEKEWQPTLLFLPGEFHGQRSLVDYSPRGCKESEMNEAINTYFTSHSKVIQLYEHTYLFCSDSFSL